MKKLIRRFSLFLLAGMLIFTSCTNKEKKMFSIVPESTLGVLTFNPGTLLEKGKIQDMDFIKQGLNDEKFINSLIMDPDESGIATKDFSAFFVFNYEEVNYGCLLMPVADEEKFEGFLKDMNAEYNVDTPSEEMEGYTFVSRDNLLFAYNEERAFALSSILSWSETSLSSVALELINTEREMSLLADKDFNKFLSTQKDINLWFSTTNVDDVPGMQQMEGVMGIFQGFKNNYAHIHLEFQDGAIVLSSNVSLNPDMKETLSQFNFLDRNASKASLQYLPADDLILAANASLNPEKLLDLIKMTGTNINRHLERIEDEMDLENKDLEDLFKGDFALSVNGIRSTERSNDFDEDFSYMKKTPIITLVAELKNKVLFTDIMSYLEKKFPVEKKDDFYVFREGGQEAYLLVNNNFLIVSNTEKSVAEIASRGNIKNNLSGSEISNTLTQDPLCLFVNLDQESYSDDVKNYINNEMDEDLAIGVKSFGSKLESLSITGGLEKSELKMKFRNDDENSLYTILAQIDSM